MENEAQHFFTCKVCGEPVDMRDLGEVFSHEHKGIELKSKHNSGRIDSSEEFLNGKEKINLN